MKYTFYFLKRIPVFTDLYNNMSLRHVNHVRTWNNTENENIWQMANQTQILIMVWTQLMKTIVHFIEKAQPLEYSL